VEQKTVSGQASSFEYDPFGNTIKSVGTAANVQPFGFSTKYTDTETGLAYYGYRFYQPTTGRWVSRDPIEERGGSNLYGMVGNDPVNHIDPYGLELYVLIWITRAGDVGHSAIAYPETIPVAGGKTVRSPYYDIREFGPAKYHDVGIDNFAANVPGNYATRTDELDSMITPGHDPVSRYDESLPQALVRIETTMEQEEVVRQALAEFAKNNPSYNGVNANCTSFVLYALKTLYGNKVNAQETLGKFTMQTPNALLKDLQGLSGKNEEGVPNVMLIRDPGSVITFKQYIEKTIELKKSYLQGRARDMVETAIGEKL
jgi:RHS repeat-associated protein